MVTSCESSAASRRSSVVLCGPLRSFWRSFAILCSHLCILYCVLYCITGLYCSFLHYHIFYQSSILVCHSYNRRLSFFILCGVQQYRAQTYFRWPGVKCACADLRMQTRVKCGFQCGSKYALYPLVQNFQPKLNFNYFRNLSTLHCYYCRQRIYVNVTWMLAQSCIGSTTAPQECYKDTRGYFVYMDVYCSRPLS